MPGSVTEAWGTSEHQDGLRPPASPVAHCHGQVQAIGGDPVSPCLPIAPCSYPMTGNLQAIGFLISWVLGWGIGGSLIDAGLIQAGVYSLEGGQLGTAATFVVWSLAWGGGGLWLYRRWTQPDA